MMNLNEAALEGDVAALQRLLEVDPLLLERSTVQYGSLPAETPLHVAILRGHTGFALELLNREPRLAESRDETGACPLHLASARGHTHLVQKMIRIEPSLCTSTDNQGRTCAHLAAIHGQVDVLKELLNSVIVSKNIKNNEKEISLARQVTSQGDTPLHLCVKHNQVEAAKFLIEKDGELVKLPDGSGNTVLHLAVVRKQTRMVKVLLDVPNVDVNARNDYNFTPLEVLLQTPSGPEDREITEALLGAGAKNSTSPKQKRVVRSPSRMSLTNKAALKVSWNNWYRSWDDAWFTEMHNTLLIVATLIATITFQTGLNPPGAVWQERTPLKDLLPPSYAPSSEYSQPGTAVGNDTKSVHFELFMYFDMIALAASLTVILMLISGLPLKTRITTWLLLIAMWISLSSMTLAFAFGTRIITGSTKIWRITSYVLFVCLGLLGLIVVIHFTALSGRTNLEVPVNGSRATEKEGDVEAGKIDIHA